MRAFSQPDRTRQMTLVPRDLRAWLDRRRLGKWKAFTPSSSTDSSRLRAAHACIGKAQLTQGFAQPRSSLEHVVRMVQLWQLHACAVS